MLKNFWGSNSTVEAWSYMPVVIGSIPIYPTKLCQVSLIVKHTTVDRGIRVRFPDLVPLKRIRGK